MREKFIAQNLLKIAKVLLSSKYTRQELEQMDWDDLTKLAYGVKSGDIIYLNPEDIKLKYPGDMVNPEYKFEKGGMAWVKSVSFSEPISVSLGDERFPSKEDWYLEDGHHRLFAAKKLKMKKIKAEVKDVNLHAIDKLLK